MDARSCARAYFDRGRPDPVAFLVVPTEPRSIHVMDEWTSRWAKRASPFGQVFETDEDADSFGRAAFAAILIGDDRPDVVSAWGCDWDLCGDEAEYWAWSRKLAWSYFSRGPVVAWLIRLGHGDARRD